MRVHRFVGADGGLATADTSEGILYSTPFGGDDRINPIVWMLLPVTLCEIKTVNAMHEYKYTNNPFRLTQSHLITEQTPANGLWRLHLTRMSYLA